VNYSVIPDLLIIDIYYLSKLLSQAEPERSD